MIAMMKYILSYLIIIYNYYLFITSIYNETYHVNKGVIVSISNTASTITLALPKSDNNNNNNNIYIYLSRYQPAIVNERINTKTNTYRVGESALISICT